MPEHQDAAVTRLRKAVDNILQGLGRTKFIQVSRGRIRLSTHRRYVSYDREALLRHPNAVVRLLAERLPDVGSPRTR